MERHDLVFGLIGALGTNVKRVAVALRQQLEVVGYKVDPDPIKLSALMHSIDGEPFNQLYLNDLRAGVEQYMTAGTKFRSDLKRMDALALLAIRAMRARRDELKLNAKSANGFAFILDSLKHGAEVETLRRIYGPAFIAIGVHSSYANRLEDTQLRLRREAHNRRAAGEYEADAKRLMKLDEDEQENPFGQHVSDAFAMADVVISDKSSDTTTGRFVKILFGDWTLTPTRDETGMYHARGAAYQSSSMARQVGAAISRKDGSIVATGTNEVPRIGGGSFDADELAAGKKDVRDFTSGYDTSDTYRREVLIDILERLCDGGAITTFSKDAAGEMADKYLYGSQPILKKAKFMATIDYTRALHAETTAIALCAKNGTPVEDCTLYVTTFPCHDCAKMIVGCGISRVVYVEPYTKSLAKDFYDNLISIDEDTTSLVSFQPFIGITPQRYAEFFVMRGDRKNALGTRQEINNKRSTPRLPEYFAPSSRITNEKIELSGFDSSVKAANVVFNDLPLQSLQSGES